MCKYGVNTAIGKGRQNSLEQPMLSQLRGKTLRTYFVGISLGAFLLVIVKSTSVPSIARAYFSLNIALANL
jgi:hypothetical protein